MRTLPVRSEYTSHGGTFVTNTSGKDTEEITASVEAFGDPEIFMKGKEMHTTRKPFDLSDFWEAHRKRISEPTTP